MLLTDSSLLIDVLANDLPGSNPNLAVVSVAQPDRGVAVIEQNAVRFTPGQEISGEAAFTYTVQDGSGLSSSARGVVVMRAPAETNGRPQRLPLPDPAVTTTLTVTVPAGDMAIQMPGGAITSSLPGATYDLIFTELAAPSLPLPRAEFAGRAFVLNLYINAELQPGYVFAQPVLLTLGYDPALVPDPSKLLLLFYDEGSGGWSSDGVTVAAVDPVNCTFTVSVAHLSEFVLGAPTPAAEEPVTEPEDPFRLYLPAISK